MRRSRWLWLWVIPVLLLATGLAAQRLSGYPMDENEKASRFLAGGKNSVSSYNLVDNLVETWATVTTLDPDQAYGLPLIYSVWGRVFGWSNFVMRALPLFAGLLALTWTYRTGRDLFAPLVGLVAAMLLATSVFFITLMHVARAFSMVALFAMMTIWSYWRIALRPPANGPGRAAQLGFVVGSIGIFYTHYYSVLLLVGLGLWHLLFMPKNRQWWRPVLLWGLAGLAFLPEVPGFLYGVTKTQTVPWFTGSTIMRTPEVLPWFLYVLTNGIIHVSGTLSIAALILLILAAAAGWWRYRQRKHISLVWFLTFTILTVLLLMLTGNEILLVMRRYRLRYWMALWPMTATLVGWGVWRTRGRWRLGAGLLIGAWVAFGLWANTASELRYEFYELLHHSRLDLADRKMKVYAGQFDLLLIKDKLGHYSDPFPKNYLILRDSPDSQAELSRAVQEHLRFWLLAGEADSVEHRAVIAQLPSDMVFCGRFVDRDDLVLELYAWSVAYCPIDTAQMRFGEEIELAASEVEVVSRDTLQVDLLIHSDEITGMTAYSVALHVFDAASGEKVAQGDRGLWVGRYNPLRSEIDISGLMAGEYELRVGVYNWQTLERLEGVDLTSGATAELLTLFRFRVE